MRSIVSLFYKGIALLYLVFPLAYGLYLVAFLSLPKIINEIGVMITPWHFVVFIFAMITGYGLIRTRTWAYHFFVIHIPFVLLMLVFDLKNSEMMLFSFLLGIGILLVFWWDLNRELRVPYFLPRLRWWEVNPHYRLKIPGFLIIHGEIVPATILDLSEKGCYLKASKVFNLNEPVKVKFQIYQAELSLSGKIVMRSEGGVTLSPGLGVYFLTDELHQNRMQKKLLKRVCHQLRKLNRFYRTQKVILSDLEFRRQWKAMEDVNLGLFHGGSSDS